MAMEIVGVDGCKAGWISFTMNEAGLTLKCFPTFIEVIKAYSSQSNFLVDIPIGLPFSIMESEQRPEAMARQYLKKKASSIFNVPCAQAAEQKTYDATNRMNKLVLHKGLSKQSFYLIKKIQEVNTFLLENKSYIHKVFECHPELAFTRLTLDKVALASSKKTLAGQLERLDLLAEVSDRFRQYREKIEATELFQKYPDDCIDACCIAIVGMLGQAKGLMTIPKEPRQNRDGLVMQMVFFDRS
ncbi:MAG TPA: DUF429 domain-containing protein [Candidatus Avamphibacillus intestinigallinarum]|nr:DUF429 domain-containing protein [Candidatus Avamphibacillus intestinigallinarum]